jgi:LPS-assembly lipoprotein
MRIAAALALGFLALTAGGCGFHPLYGDRGATAGNQEKLASIFVEPVPEGQDLGYELRNTLIDLFDASGRSEGAAYRLKLTLGTKSEGVALENDAAITRYNDTITVGFELVDAHSNASIMKGVETGLSAYNVVASPYATLTAQRDADTRSAEDIAYRIRTDLAVFFAYGNRTVPKKPATAKK